METVIDIRTALEQFGLGWQFGGSVTDGTQDAWDAVKWEDSRDKPTWADLCAAHEGVALGAALEKIVSEHKTQRDDLINSFVMVSIVDGAPMESNVALLRAKWADNIAAEQAAVDALLGVL